MRSTGSGRLRGLLDELRGGVGLRRGRRHPHELRVGDAVDFWRVEHLEPGRRLRLAAEMKIPGRLWLQFEVKPDEGRLRDTPDHGVRPGRICRPGLLVPALPGAHHVFRAMLHGLRRATIAASDPAR